LLILTQTNLVILLISSLFLEKNCSLGVDSFAWVLQLLLSASYGGKVA